MKIQLIRILSAIIAGSIIMILHELPKAILYNKVNKGLEMKSTKNIYKLHHYIDPIGMILCITNQASFSKPYMYRIKDKKTNFLLGITGFLSLMIIFTFSMLILKFSMGMDSRLTYSVNIGTLELILQCIVVYFALISSSMLIVNLFPISTFDMGLCIAGKSPSKYFSLIRNDYLLKTVLIILILMQVVTNISTLVITMLL